MRKLLPFLLLALLTASGADEALVRVGPLDHAAVGRLEAEYPLSVDDYADGYAYCVTRVEDLAGLVRLEHPWVVLCENLQAAAPPSPSADRDEPWNDFHTYAETIALLQSWADDPDYSDICRYVDLGLDSVSGRELAAIVISDNVDVEEYEPEVRVVGTHHGNEMIANEVTLYCAERLLTGYVAGDPESVALVEGNEIWLQPLVNPDGYVADSRYNSHGVDLNRNYSYQWESGYGHGSHPFSEPESQAVADYSGGDENYVPDNVEDNTFVLGLTHHSGAVCVNYVWNYQYIDAPDKAHIWHNISQSYSDGCEESAYYDDLTYHGGYMDWITEGWVWYETHGDTNDWSYGMRGCIDTTIELSEGQSQSHPEGSILALCDVNWEATKNYLDWADYGLHGLCTDENDDPILTMITVDDRDEAFFYNDPREHGDYWLSLDDGTYDIVYSADGYDPIIHENVSVTGESTPALDVQFIPSDAPVLELQARNTDDGVLLSWSTAEDFAAFNLYRVGPRGTSVGDRLNERPLPAAARSFLDLSPGCEPRRYRLETVDAAGHRMVFGPVEIVPESDASRLSLACYPQPARTAVTVEFTADDEPAVLNVYDLAGRLVLRRELGTVTGRSSLTLNVADYDAGVYLLSLEAGERRLTRCLVVSR